MFLIFGWKRADNPLIFLLLQSRVCTAARPLLVPTLPCTIPLQCMGWKRAWDWEGTRLGQPSCTDQRDTTDHIMLCSAVDAQGTEGKEECSWSWCLSSQSTAMCAEAMLPRKQLDVCLLIWSSEWITLFALLPCTALAVMIKMPLSWATNLLTFLLFPLHLMRECRSEQPCG